MTDLGGGYETSALTDRAYAGLPEVYRKVDPANGNAMLRLLSAVADGTGAGQAEVDLDRFAAALLVGAADAPVGWVRWLAQHLGVKRNPSHTEAEEREAVANAASGWRSGTSPALADAVRQGIRPYSAKDTHFVVDPDTSSAYIMVPDNMFDADTAHTHQSKGNWSNRAATTDNGVLTDEVPAFFGDNCVKFTALTGGSQYAQPTTTAVGTPGAGPTVDALTEYTFSCYVRATRAGERFKAAVIFMSETDNNIGSQSSNVGYIDCPVGVWTQVWGTFTTVANTTRVRPYLQREKTDDDGNVFYVDGACLREGTDPTFKPSTYIDGVIDLRVRGDSFYDDATGYIIDGVNATSGYSLRATNTGKLSVLVGDGTTNTALTSDNVTAPQYQVVWAKAVINPDNAGDITADFYVAEDGPEDQRVWTSLGPTETAVGAGGTVDYSAVVSIGIGGPSAPHVGRIFEAEVRDGEDGPVVMRFDVTDMDVTDEPPPFSDPTTGHDWTLQVGADTAALKKYPERPFVGLLKHYLGDPWVIGVVTSVFDSPADTTIIANAIERAGARPAGFDIVFVDYSASWDDVESGRPTWADWEPNSWDTIENTQP